MSNIKEDILKKIEDKKDIFIDASHKISARPELQNEEFFAQELLCKLLEGEGFEVKKDIAGHKTGFIAKKSSGEGPQIAFLAEYDALPEIGHGCGHNLMGTLASLAGVASAEILKKHSGSIFVYGTPAEEGGDNGSAKASFADAGLFKDIDVAMLIHPSSRSISSTGSLAVHCYAFEFFGQTAHAAAAPEKGKNALDAMILFFSGINALRQQVTTDVRIHGIITDGGLAPNVIPDYTKAKFFIRAKDIAGCDVVLEKVKNIAEGAALSTGCITKYAPFNNTIKDMILNEKLDDVFLESANSLSLGYEKVSESGAGSSDVGNVSYEIPTIQPYIKICDDSVSGHTIEFAAAAISPLGDAALVSGASALALTALALFEDRERLKEIKDYHKTLI